MPNYIITEPMPTTTTYMRSGRGGAGNTFRVPSGPRQPPTQVISTDAPASASASAAAAASSQQPRRYHSGIGGAGNVHMTSEKPTLSLDERFRRMVAREQHATVGRCGIGGAGNVYRKPEPVADDAASVNSRTRLWTRVSSTFSRD